MTSYTRSFLNDTKTWLTLKSFPVGSIVIESSSTYAKQTIVYKLEAKSRRKIISWDKTHLEEPSEVGLHDHFKFAD